MYSTWELLVASQHLTLLDKQKFLVSYINFNAQIQQFLDWASSTGTSPVCDFTCTLLGFNPLSVARKTPIEGWTRTFSDVSNCMNKLISKGDQRFFIITPMYSAYTFFLINLRYGPEGVTGSTRMKGGSATKIIIDTVLALCLKQALQVPVELSTDGNLFAPFSATIEETYNNTAAISDVVTSAGKSLKSGGHVYYLAASTMGMIQLIDASECPPTYGASPTEVRAFLHGGWSTVANYAGDLSHLGVIYCISMAQFINDVAPKCDSSDTIVIFNNFAADCLNYFADALRSIESLPSKPSIFAFTFKPRASPQENEVTYALHKLATVFIIELSHVCLLPGLPSFLELSAKLIANAITTGAFTLSGKVYRNIMADLRISNVKLYYRAINIVMNLSGVPRNVAETCVLRAVNLFLLLKP